MLTIFCSFYAATSTSGALRVFAFSFSQQLAPSIWFRAYSWGFVFQKQTDRSCCHYWILWYFSSGVHAPFHIYMNTLLRWVPHFFIVWAKWNDTRTLACPFLNYAPARCWQVAVSQFHASFFVTATIDMNDSLIPENLMFALESCNSHATQAKCICAAVTLCENFESFTPLLTSIVAWIEKQTVKTSQKNLCLHIQTALLFTEGLF